MLEVSIIALVVMLVMVVVTLGFFCAYYSERSPAW